MPPAKSLDADSPLAVWGAMLRHHREQAGWTQEQLGEMVHFSVAQISSLETARRNPTAETARSLDAALGLRGALAELLARLKAAAARQVLPAWFRSFVQVEEEAHTIRSWQPLLVDGLLQTAGYARAILRAGQPGATDEEVEALVEARLGRQAVLSRTDRPPPVLYVILDEGVLHRPVGDAKVMGEQLDHLLAMARTPKITIQVVPSDVGANAGLTGAFVIASLKDGDIVHLDGTTRGWISDSAEDVTAITRIHDALRADVLPQNQSLAAIEKARKTWI